MKKKNKTAFVSVHLTNKGGPAHHLSNRLNSVDLPFLIKAKDQLNSINL